MANKGDLWYGLFDKYKKEYVIKKIWVGAESACDLLNKLNNESEELKKEIEELKWNLELERGCGMNKQTENIEVCAEVSTKRMFLLLMKAQEMILENNPQYEKREILTLLSSVTHDVKMLDDKNNCISRDLYD